MQTNQKYAPLLHVSILALSFCAWLKFRLLYPDIMGGVDVFHFKDPGCNMAMGHGFVSSAFVGSESFERLIWLSQGPLYPYAFGLFASGFGCNSSANNIFELLIASILTTQAVFLTTRFNITGIKLFTLIGLAIFMPTGGYEWEQDRPDHLALAFVLSIPIFNILCKEYTTKQRWSYFFAGLALITSPYYGFVGAALSTLHLILPKAPQNNISAKLVITNAVTFLTPLLAVIIIYTNADPTGFSRFLNHANIITSTNVSFLNKLKHGISSAGLISYLNFSRFALTAFFLIFVIFRKNLTERSIQLRKIAGALLLLMGITILAFPKQGNYFSAISFVAIIVYINSSDQLVSPSKISSLQHATLISILFATLMPGVITSVIIPIRMLDSFLDQKSRIENQLHRDQNKSFKSITTVPPSHFFLYKESLDYIFDPNYINSKHNLDFISATVVCRAGKKSDIYASDLPGWHLTNSPSTPPIRGGIPGVFTMNSYWDWGCFLFQKTSKNNPN